MQDRYDTGEEKYQLALERFTKAQDNVYPRVMKELQQGDKQTHWMWFIFPQVDGLGVSVTAKFYAIKNKEEALAYFNHPLLGMRLLECTAVLLQLQGKTADQVFGSPDNVKLQSCMTLFAAVIHTEPMFEQVLAKYYQGKKDQRTIDILKQ